MKTRGKKYQLGGAFGPGQMQPGMPPPSGMMQSSPGGMPPQPGMMQTGPGGVLAGPGGIQAPPGGMPNPSGQVTTNVGNKAVKTNVAITLKNLGPITDST